jgi:hypothetical protein
MNEYRVPAAETLHNQRKTCPSRSCKPFMTDAYKKTIMKFLFGSSPQPTKFFFCYSFFCDMQKRSSFCFLWDMYTKSLLQFLLCPVKLLSITVTSMTCISAHYFSFSVLQKTATYVTIFCYCLSHNPQRSSTLLFFLSHMYWVPLLFLLSPWQSSLPSMPCKRALCNLWSNIKISLHRLTKTIWREQEI